MSAVEMRTLGVACLECIRSVYEGVTYCVKNVKCKSKNFVLGAELRQRGNFAYRNKTKQLELCQSISLYDPQT